MASKLREQILNTNDIQTELVYVDAWKVDVEVRGMTGKERAKILNDLKGQLDFERMYPQIVISSTYDPETGEKVFEWADIDMLNSKSGAALEKIAGVALQLSGLKDGQVAEAEKNSEKTRNSDSISS